MIFGHKEVKVKPVDVTRVDCVAENSIACRAGDNHSTLGCNLKGLVVAA